MTYRAMTDIEQENLRYLKERGKSEAVIAYVQALLKRGVQPIAPNN